MNRFEEEWAKNETASAFYNLAKFWYEKGSSEISRLKEENERLTSIKSKIVWSLHELEEEVSELERTVITRSSQLRTAEQRVAELEKEIEETMVNINGGDARVVVADIEQRVSREIMEIVSEYCLPWASFIINEEIKAKYKLED